MKPLSKGDTCRVRLHTGEVVEAVYDEPCENIEKHHWVLINGRVEIAGPDLEFADCRFVGNPCVLLPVGVSV